MASRPLHPETESFAGLLLRHRGRTGLTQRDLAARLGTSRRSVQDWESGLSYPTGERLQALIQGLLEAGGLMLGREQVEAHELWAAVLREAPRMHTPLDAVWLEGLLAEHSAPRTDVTRDVIAAAPALKAAEGNGLERRQDWGEAPDVIGFVGRAEELATLRNWVLEERCRVAAVLGMGGIGKTALASRLAQDAAPSFLRVYWRSLRDALPAGEWMAGAIGFLSAHQLVPPEGESARLAVLLELLRDRRCLLLLDNFETVLEPGQQEGHYRDGFAGYGALLHAIGETRHQSCLVVTSREAPPELAVLGSGTVRKLQLGGLRVAEGQVLLAAKQLSGTDEDWANLIARFGGNGLALKVVGESILQVFDGDIGGFLGQAASGLMFGGIRRLLAEQIERSSTLEQKLLRVLAVEREPVSLARLIAHLGPRVNRGAVLEAVEALRRRSLVERAETDGAAAFTLQSVVLEYVTDRLVEDVADEIARGQPVLLVDQPLIKAQAKDYVRQTQERLIGESILQQLRAEHGDDGAEQRLLALLEGWRNRPQAEQGYGSGNTINILRLLRADLQGLDLSYLFIRQAYLQEVEAQDASLAGAILDGTVLAGAFDAVNAVALSADGTLVAAGTLGGEVRVWRAADRMPLLSAHGHAGLVGGVALSGDGRLLASGGQDGVLQLWDALGGRPLATLKGHTGAVYGVAMTPDGGTIASCGLDGTVKLWHADRDRPVASLEGHTGGVSAVAVSPNGRTVVSGTLDGTVRLWDAVARRPTTEFNGHPGGIVRVAISADGLTIACCSRDGSVRVWERDGTLLTMLDGQAGGVYGVALSADGRMVAGGGFDGTLRLRAANGGRPLATLQGHSGAIMGVAVTADGATVASGSLDGTVRLWEVAGGGRPLATLQGHSDAVMTVAISADDRLIASGSFDGIVRLWAAESGSLLATLRGHTGVIYGVALSADGRKLASSGNDANVGLWDSAGQRLLATFQGHTGAVGDVAIDADGRMVASGGLDGTVRLWDAESLRSLATLQTNSGSVYSVALSSDGRLLASGGVDGSVRFWEPHTARLLLTMEGHTSAVNGIALSADGRLLASGSHDGTVRIWDTAEGRLMAVLEGHIGGVYGVAVAADGRTVASCGQDGMVRLWDVATGRSLAALPGHIGAVRGIAFTASGRMIISGGLDGTVRLWDRNTLSLVRTLRADRRYERMDITDLSGVTEAQRTVLIALGATEDTQHRRGAAAGPDRARCGGPFR